MNINLIGLSVFGLTLATTALSDIVQNDDLIVTGDICVGAASCVDGEVFGNTDIKIKSSVPEILLLDTTSGSNNDWAIKGDDNDAGAPDSFSIRNTSTGNVPFAIAPQAETSAIFIDGFGNVGLGTTLPENDLHIASLNIPAIRLERTNGVTPYSWRISADHTGFAITDLDANDSPFIIQSGAPTAAFYMLDNEDIGLGTTSPNAALHLIRSNNTASILVQDSGASGAQEMFKMANNGGSFFTLDNTASDTQWFFVHENASPNRFIISDGVADGPEMSLTAEGDLTIEGNFIAGSTQLNVPDYVFAPDYDLRPLAQVASFVKTNRHLPDVPSAAQIGKEGLDMTGMQMTLLRKVEELTLYTLEQEAELIELRALKSEMAQIKEMLANR